MEGDHPPMAGVAPYPEPYHPDAAVAGETVELLREYARGAGGADAPEARRPARRPAGARSPWSARSRRRTSPSRCPSRSRRSTTRRACRASRRSTTRSRASPEGRRTHPWLQLGAHLSWPEWQRVIAHYWGFCTYVDALFGRVLQALDDLGLAERHPRAGHGRPRRDGRAPPHVRQRAVLLRGRAARAPGLALPGPDHAPRGAGRVAGEPRGRDAYPAGPARRAPPPRRAALPGAEPGTPPHLRRPAWSAEAVFGEATGGERGDRVNPQADARVVVTRAHKYVYRPGDVDELYDLAAGPGGAAQPRRKRARPRGPPAAHAGGVDGRHRRSALRADRFRGGPAGSA